MRMLGDGPALLKRHMIILTRDMQKRSPFWGQQLLISWVGAPKSRSELPLQSPGLLNPLKSRIRFSVFKWPMNALLWEPCGGHHLESLLTRFPSYRSRWSSPSFLPEPLKDFFYPTNVTLFNPLSPVPPNWRVIVDIGVKLCTQI